MTAVKPGAIKAVRGLHQMNVNIADPAGRNPSQQRANSRTTKTECKLIAERVVP